MTSDSNNLELISMNDLMIERTECIYTSCYCEENIWKLCEYISLSHKKHLINCFVVFISNDKQTVPLWKQRSGDKCNDFLSVWDYHVILIYSPNGFKESFVYDFDTKLSFPTHFDTYSKETFRDEDTLKQEYHRMFRVIEAQLYLNKFASNRSRMLKPDGSWIKPPPEYPCIQTNDCDNNLEHFISMNNNQFEMGFVMNLKELNVRFSKSIDGLKNDQML